jgi:acetyl esterase/lipase
MIQSITKEYQSGLHLDIHYTADIHPNTPVVFLVHGGAFMVGDSSIMRGIAMDLAGLGYVSVAPNYTLSKMNTSTYLSFVTVQAMFLSALAFTTKSKFDVSVLIFLVLISIFADCKLLHSNCSKYPVQYPKHVQDVAAALRWTKDNIGGFGGDSENLFLMGHSAGGYLVSMLACDVEVLRQQNLSQDDVRGVVCVSGVFSKARLCQTFLGRSLYEVVFPSGGNGDFPIDKIHLGQPPPHFFINANCDYTLKRHTLDMYFALKEHGTPVCARVYEKNSHFSIHQDWGGNNRHILKSVLKFVETHVKI